MVNRKINVIKPRWFKFWKDKQVIVLTDCHHKWKQKQEIELKGWWGVNDGKQILLECDNCGNLKQINMRDSERRR